MAEKLAPEELNDGLGGLDGWTVAEGRNAIQKTFKFGDFKQAFGFMTRVLVDSWKFSERRPS